MNLTVCMLTRNEEAKLPRVLGSVAGIADEVIVADTGSTDNTAAVAQQLGARIEAVAWDDDFSSGQNQALDAARGDWILWLNADEELDAASRPALTWCMQQASALGWYVRVWDYPRANVDTFTETLQPRLFRHGKGIRYRGRLHPSFETPLEDLARQHHMSVGPADVRVRRHAYLSTLTEDKLRWAARLLAKELADRPGQLHYLIEYGRTLLHLRDPHGHDVLAEAAQKVLRSADAPAAPLPTVGLLLEYVLTSPGAVANPLTAERAKELGLRWFAATPPVLWAMATHEFHAGRFAEAIPLLERLTQLGLTGRYDRSAAFEPGIVGGLAWQNLGICYSRLSDWARAELCFAKLLTMADFREKGLQLYAWVQQQRQGKPTA